MKAEFVPTNNETNLSRRAEGTGSALFALHWIILVAVGTGICWSFELTSSISINDATKLVFLSASGAVLFAWWWFDLGPYGNDRYR